MAAEPRGRPGCPDLAFCTASTARKRNVFTQSSSSSGGAMVVESVMVALCLLYVDGTHTADAAATIPA